MLQERIQLMSFKALRRIKTLDNRNMLFKNRENCGDSCLISNLCKLEILLTLFIFIFFKNYGFDLNWLQSKCSSICLQRHSTVEMCKLVTYNVLVFSIPPFCVPSFVFYASYVVCVLVFSLRSVVLLCSWDPCVTFVRDSFRHHHPLQYVVLPCYHKRQDYIDNSNRILLIIATNLTISRNNHTFKL